MLHLVDRTHGARFVELLDAKLAELTDHLLAAPEEEQPDEALAA